LQHHCQGGKECQAPFIVRDNGPTPGREIMLADDQLLVSRTDTKGRMTFANKAFADVSGFSGTELLGAPHNLTLLQRGDFGCRVPLPLVLITLRRVGPGVRTRHRRGAGWHDHSCIRRVLNHGLGHAGLVVRPVGDERGKGLLNLAQ
jgi:PAS domain-containing protein